MSESEPIYQKCVRLGIADALRSGRMRVLESVSAHKHVEMPEPFYYNTMPFQYAYWGHIFFTLSGEKHIGNHDAVQALEIAHGGMVARDGTVILEDGTVIDAGLQFLKHWQPESFFRVIDGELRILVAEPLDITGKYCAGVGTADGNYAHWATCTLPVWKYFADKLMADGTKLVVGTLTKFHREALALLGIGEGALFHMPDAIVRFGSLTMLSPIDMWRAATCVGETGRAVARLAAAEGSDRPMPRLVYLSRRDIGTRALLNEAALEAMLNGHGFTSIAAGDLSFGDQVRLMAGADIVIGLHGAALANFIFCTPGTPVIEVFPEYCVQPHFRTLAERARLPFGFVQGTSFEEENARERNTAWVSSFVVDVDLVEAAIQEAQRLASSPAFVG